MTPLRSATGLGYTIDTYPYKFIVDACQNVPCASSTFPPTKKAGGCQYKPTQDKFDPRVLGQLNTTIVFRDGQLSLVYDNGDVDKDIARASRKMIITFICDQNAGKGSPTYSGELNGLVYLFEWRTAYACFSHIECRVTDAKLNLDYHLDELIRDDANWVVSDTREGGKYEYELNVCRPLVATARWDCSPFAASCQKSKEGVDYDLGFVSGPQLTADGQLFLEYTEGSSEWCNGGFYKRTTHIDFQCNPKPGQLGAPVFDYEDSQCVFYFTWVTSAACKRDSATDIGQNCKITEPASGEVLDLSKITGNNSLLAVIDAKNVSFGWECGEESRQRQICNRLLTYQLTTGVQIFCVNLR